MRVQVNWVTDNCSVGELGLPTIVDMPTLSMEFIVDYLTDKYDYLVESFTIIDLDSGYWYGDDAWVLYDDGGELVILVGGYTLEQAIKVKEMTDDDIDLGEYNDYVVWTDKEEWIEQQE